MTLYTICGAGSDPDLDQLISSLVHTNRQKPRPLIDTMMLWRKAKGDDAMHAKKVRDNVSLVHAFVVEMLRDGRHYLQTQCREAFPDETQELRTTPTRTGANLLPLLTIQITQHHIH